MKHAYLAPALLLFAANLHAQIEITSAQMPVVGDEVIRYLDTLPSFVPGGAGADQLWDFSAAEQDIEQVNTFVDPATTPNGDQFGSSNLALTTDGLNYSFISNTATEMTTDGFSGDPLGDGTLTLDAPFDPVLTLHQFPRQYNTNFTDDYAFDVTIDGSDFGVYQARIKSVGSVADTTDAYGSITTPVGTYDCLRSKTTSIRTDSVFAQLIEILPMTFLFANVDTTTTYIWHAMETKLPVAELVMDSVGGALSFTWSSIEPNSTAVSEGAASPDGWSLFPQPAMDRVRISVEGSSFVSVTVNDLDGRAVLRNARVMTNDWLDLSDLPAAVYVVNATSASGHRFAQRLVHLSAR